MFYCCCVTLHRHQLHLISYGCVSFTLCVIGVVFTVFAVFQKDSIIGRVWLAGPVLMVVAGVLCGKVMIDWGPAMAHARNGSIDSRIMDEYAFSNLVSIGGVVPLLKAPLRPFANRLSSAEAEDNTLPSGEEKDGSSSLFSPRTSASDNPAYLKDSTEECCHCSDATSDRVPAVFNPSGFTVYIDDDYAGSSGNLSMGECTGTPFKNNEITSSLPPEAIMLSSRKKSAWIMYDKSTQTCRATECCSNKRILAPNKDVVTVTIQGRSVEPTITTLKPTIQTATNYGTISNGQI